MRTSHSTLGQRRTRVRAACSSSAANNSPTRTATLLPDRGAAVLLEPPRQPGRSGHSPRTTEQRSPARRPAPISNAIRQTEPHRAAAPSWSSSTVSAASTTDGREYVTPSGPDQSTPAPWLNVIANPVVRLPGLGVGVRLYVVGNSRENQLTPWSNDPVSDPAGEAIYVRDDDTAELWGPTALPIRLRGVDLRRPARRRVQPLRASAPRHPARIWCSSCRPMTRSRFRC